MRQLHNKPEEDPALHGADLHTLLEEVYVGVVDYDMIDTNDGQLDGLLGWRFVGTPTYGPVAYFSHEDTALRFRLDVINRVLNG